MARGRITGVPAEGISIVKEITFYKRIDNEE